MFLPRSILEKNLPPVPYLHSYGRTSASKAGNAGRGSPGGANVFPGCTGLIFCPRDKLVGA